MGKYNLLFYIYHLSPMKKLTPFFLVLSLFAFSSFGFADSSLDNAISWMNENWLTKFTNAQDFMSSWNLRRDEATKFFVQYAKTVLKSVPDENKTDCNKFSDLKEGWSDLADTMKDACKLGLFNGANGKFMPKQNLTNAQALTVLIRMIDGKKDESQGHFAQKYFEKAQELGIMKWLSLNSTTNFDKLTTRWDIAILLYNSAKNKENNIEKKVIINKATIDRLTFTWSYIDKTKPMPKLFLTKWYHNFVTYYRWATSFYIWIENWNWTLVDYAVPKLAKVNDPIISYSNYVANIPLDGEYTLKINTTNNKWDIFIDPKWASINYLFPINLSSIDWSQQKEFFLQKGEYKVLFNYSWRSNFIVHLLDKDNIIVDYLANEIWSRNWVEAMTIKSDWYYKFDVESGIDSSRTAEILPRN